MKRKKIFINNLKELKNKLLKHLNLKKNGIRNNTLKRLYTFTVHFLFYGIHKP